MGSPSHKTAARDSFEDNINRDDGNGQGDTNGVEARTFMLMGEHTDHDSSLCVGISQTAANKL